MSVGKFVDVEGRLIRYLRGAIPPQAVDRILTDLPADIAGLRIVRVTRTGGSSDELGTTAQCDVQMFAPDRAAVWTLTGIVNDAVARIAGHPITDPDGSPAGSFDAVRAITAPVSTFWSPTTQSAIGVYEFDLRVY